MLAGSPLHGSVDGYFDSLVRLGDQSCFVADAMLEPCSALGIEPGAGVEDSSGDEVVP